MLKQKPALQYSEGRSRTWSGAKLVNCFVEKADGDKREDLAVLSTPGLELWAIAGIGPFRGGLELAGTAYVVSGDGLYSVSSLGVVTWLGSIPGSGSVRMASNYTELCIVSDNVGYVYSGGVLYTPLDYDVSDVTYADGYILWVVASSEMFFISALDDALTYDALDITSVEGSPDDIVGVINNHREITFLGIDTTEIYYNSGNADFPFERQGNAFIEYGCFDRDSIAKLGSAIFFVGSDRIVYSMQGYQVQRISTHAIEYELRSITYARAFTYTQEGHKFYCLEVNGVTLLFDISTGAWHKRQSSGMLHWRIGQSFTAYGKILFGDRTNGNIYTPSLDLFTENGETIAVDITLPTIEAARERMTMYAFEVLCETGNGSAQAMLTYSDDGGHLWSNEMWRDLGVIGAHRTRAIWRRLGQFRQRQMKLRITDAGKKLVINWWADIQ